MVFELETLDYHRLEQAVRTWIMLRDLRDAPRLPLERWWVYDSRLKKARQELNTARADLDRQRKAGIEAWTKPRGLRVDWSNWERALGV